MLIPSAGARGEGADGAGGVLAQALAVLAGGAIDAVDARENFAGVAEHARRDTARRAVLARVAGVAPIDTAIFWSISDLSMGMLQLATDTYFVMPVLELNVPTGHLLGVPVVCSWKAS